ncbi:hypothetical protein RCG17_22975 [Neobacillus sp. PS3-12]|uniref:hypothetical protein n=1 Tax=Neobacillus sp. PS3-12 TaxID=3070677 RepID=UPI0027DFF416|nr:hypothetical protein [Neobacillus sp. PS3-12]WML52222.1 hypothetical protein RCG17_22975 [Neobacillus sp. PS3-12]
MTAVLCYTTDYLSLIISNKRVSYGKYAEAGYTDEYEKLVNLPEMGWAAGAGAAGYLDQLKESLANTVISSVQDIMDVYNKVSTSFSLNPFYSEEDLNSSAVVASWIGFDEEINSIKFRIGVLSSEHIGQEGMGSLRDNQIFTLYPIDYIEDEDKIRDLWNRHGWEYQFNGDINALFEKMFTILNEISSHSKYVSSTCDIGLQILLGDGIYKVKFSGEIDELINEVKANCIHERYQLISRIGSND